jgi:hypothetical protein
LEGRISDLDSMIAQDEYWEKKNVWTNWWTLRN